MTVAACACGCCSGAGDRTPLGVENRPGLSALAYRVGTHGDFLASMVAGLTSLERPRLAEMTTRDSDDFTIALLDAWASTCDVLTFYTERLAHESYLKTARERISLQELGRLIGYRLRPGVAAETYVAFALERPPEVPAAVSPDPGSAPSVTPREVTLEEGLRIQSIPGPGEKPQTFETVEEISARPEWNAVRAATTVPFTPDMHDVHAWLQGSALNLKPGDVLLLAGADVVGDRWDVRPLKSVTPYPPPAGGDPADGRTLVTWAHGLGSINPSKAPADDPEPFVLRKRINVYGHNAPKWTAMTAEFRTGYRAGATDTGEWPGFVLSPAGGNAVDLDGSHPDVVVGSWVVLSKPSYAELWKVKSVTELSRADFATSGKVTRIVLEGGENFDLFQAAVRDTTVFAVSEPLALAEADDTTDVSGDEIALVADVTGMEPGRRVLIAGRTTAGEEDAEVGVLAERKTVDGKCTIVLEDGLAGVYERESVVVHGNVALATHGETVEQLLGSGRAGVPFQRFPLAQAPLTYRQSTDPSGVDSALEVRVNEVRWDEVPSLYPAGPGDRVYAVREDAAGRTYVQFGDGARGARPASGSQNVRAVYRKGIGAAGNVRSGALSVLLDRPLGVKGVTNARPAAGGVDPEAEEAARTSMPLGVRTLGRAVSLLDYQDFARAFAGVAKAHAAVLPLRAGRTIVVTVAFEGAPADATERVGDLTTSLRAYGDPHVHVTVVQHHTQTFELALRVAVDPAYDKDAVVAEVESALRAAWSFERRELTQPVHRSQLVSVAHSVDGVVAVDVDRLYTGASPQVADRLAAQVPYVTPAGAAAPAGLLLLDPGPLDWLEVMT